MAILIPIVSHARPLSEEDHIHGYERIFFLGGRRVHRDIGYIPPGARTEDISDTTLPHGLRCEEIKVPGSDGHSLFGLVVSTSGTSRDDSKSAENPETLFFYLQGPTFTTHLPESALTE